MEPRIQYAKTADGVNIAYSVIGEGPPFVIMPGVPISELQVGPYIPDVHTFYERISAAHRVVRYDARGSGLSDREVGDYSLEAQLLDLEAVVNGAGLEAFAVWGMASLAAATITYAARHPERVTRLILLNAWLRGADFFGSPDVEALVTLIDRNWTLFTETIAHVWSDWDPGVNPHRLAEFVRESMTQESARRFFAAARGFDAGEASSLVQAPTLVLQRKQLQWPDLSMARSLAAAIPRAELVVLEGGYGWVGEQGVEAVLDFLGGRAAPAVPPAEPAAVHTILFTDIEGSTAMTQRLGDAKAREVLREHERMTRECLRAHGGSEVKTMGDGFMASFGSAVKALECAIAVQRAFDERNREVGAHHDAPLRVRIGLNAGEPIAEDDPDGRGDLFGTAVIAAARIAARAAGGEILVSDVVRQLVAGKGFLFADQGDIALRGFEDPVRLYEVRWRD